MQLFLNAAKVEGRALEERRQEETGGDERSLFGYVNEGQ